jgi:hypothetical protein
MNRKLIPLVILTLLAFATLSAIPASAATDKPVVVAVSKGAIEPDTQLKAMMNISYIDWRVVLGDITPSDLSGADMMIVSLSDASQVYSSAELAAIQSWFSTGGKTIYVAGDSDYVTDRPRIPQQNAILNAIGSKLRIEECSVEDAVSNGGAPYRVLGTSANCDPAFSFLVAGVDRALFHGPSIVIGYENGQYVDLSKNTMEDVYVIMTTTENGLVVDGSEPTPYVMVAGEEGEFPLMAIEVDYAKGNTIIVAGESPYDQYMGMYKPEMLRADRYGPDANPQQGQYLVENLLKYGTSFGAKILGQTSTIMQRDATIDSLNGQIADLQSQVTSFTNNVNDLNTQIEGLKSQLVDLQAEVVAAQSSASTMQLAAIAALVIGIIVGYFVGPMIKKQ